MKAKKIAQPKVEPDFVTLTLTRSESLRLLILAGNLSWKDLSKEHLAQAKRLLGDRPEGINDLTSPLYDTLLEVFGVHNIDEIKP